MAYVLDDWEEIQARSARQLPTGNNDVPWGTGLVEGAKDLGSRAVNQLQEWAKEDPDTWTDDAVRLMGGGVKNVGNTMADWESRSEEGEVGTRSAAGTALRFMNWASEQGARLGRTGARAVGANEELGGFLGSFLPEALGTKGLSKVAQVGKTTRQLSKLRKLGITDWQLDDITKGYHAMAFGDQPTSLLGDIKTAATTSKKARQSLSKLSDSFIPEGWNKGKFTRFTNKMGDGVQEALVAHNDALKYYNTTGRLRGRPGGNIWHNPANNKYYLIKNKAASGKPPIIGCNTTFYTYFFLFLCRKYLTFSINYSILYLTIRN